MKHHNHSQPPARPAAQPRTADRDDLLIKRIATLEYGFQLLTPELAAQDLEHFREVCDCVVAETAAFVKAMKKQNHSPTILSARRDRNVDRAALPMTTSKPAEALHAKLDTLMRLKSPVMPFIANTIKAAYKYRPRHPESSNAR